MPVRNLDRIFKPQRVAVIGASDREASVGYSVLHNLISTGFGGVVYPVNNKREAVQGIQAYPSVSELPHCPDLAIIATPAATVPGLVTECGRAGVGGVIILSAGFGEVGREGKTLQSSLKQAAAEFPKLRIIGPNCLGIIAPHRRLNASFAATPAEPGNVAFISQSGALCTSILEWAEREKIGFSAFVSIGNMIDVNVADLIDYFSEDPHTTSVILYLESITGSAVVSVGGAGVHAEQADCRVQVGAFCGVGKGSGVAHRGTGRRRRGVRRGVSAGGSRAGLGPGRAVRHGRVAGTARTTGRRPTGDRDECGWSGRDRNRFAGGQPG